MSLPDLSIEHEEDRKRNKPIRRRSSIWKNLTEFQLFQMKIPIRSRKKILECVNTIKGKESTRSTKSASNRVSITGFVYDSLSKIVPDKKPPPTPKRDYNEDQNQPTEPDDDGWGSDFDSPDEDNKDYLTQAKPHVRAFNNNETQQPDRFTKMMAALDNLYMPMNLNRSSAKYPSSIRDERNLANPPPVPCTAGRRPVPPIPNTQKTLPIPNTQKGHRELPPVPGQNESSMPQPVSNHRLPIKNSPPKPMPQQQQHHQVPDDRFDFPEDLEEYARIDNEDILNYKEQCMPPPRPTRFGGLLNSPSQPQILTSPTATISPTTPTHTKFSLPVAGDNNNNKHLPPVPKVQTPTPPTGHKLAGTFLKSQSCSTLTNTLKGHSIHAESDKASDKQLINNHPGLNEDDESNTLMKPSEFRDRFKKFENTLSSSMPMPQVKHQTAISVKKSQSFQTKPSFPSGESVDSGHGSDPPSPQLKLPGHQGPTQNLPSSRPIPVSPPAQPTMSPTATTKLTSVGRPLPAAPKDEEMESLYSHPWYHADVTRDNAKKNLEKHATNGMFLVRKSAGTNTACPYALSLYQSNSVYNLHIRLRSDNKYALGMEKPDEPAFLKVPDLVTFFKSNTLLLSGQRATATKLTTAAPKSMRH